MKRILSIDGGGIRGCLPACALMELEQQTGKLTRDSFDFVAGTSTGALIAAAVAAGVPATRILDIYLKRTPEIFNHGIAEAWGLRLTRGWAYDPRNIARVLASEFGVAAEWSLNDSPIRILLTARGVGQQPWYFVQDRPRNAKTTGKLHIIDCAVASAAAPTYFAPWYVPPLAGSLVGWCFDGGTGVTGNPVYQACVEAFEYDDFTPADTRVISLGTGFHPGATVNPPEGLLATLSWTIDSLTSAPEDQQTEIVQRHYPGIMQRFNWPLPAAVDMADVSAVPGLVDIGRKLAAEMDWNSILK
ncbi:MAG TPA: patatin-like phospholipase family protein [Bryobacteraceae bacterium]|nr:patatin-like phospholipase family protein [Bryobacteraceae bacterium]